MKVIHLEPNVNYVEMGEYLQNLLRRVGSMQGVVFVVFTNNLAEAQLR